MVDSSNPLKVGAGFNQILTRTQTGQVGGNGSSPRAVRLPQTNVTPNVDEVINARTQRGGADPTLRQPASPDAQPAASSQPQALNVRVGSSDVGNLAASQPPGQDINRLPQEVGQRAARAPEAQTGNNVDRFA